MKPIIRKIPTPDYDSQPMRRSATLGWPASILPEGPIPIHSAFGRPKPTTSWSYTSPFIEIFIAMATFAHHSTTLLLALIATVFVLSTRAASVELTVTATIPTPIIGDAIFEDITTPAPIIGDAIFENITNVTISRHLQAAYPPDGFQQEMLDAVNKERTSRGLSKLCMNTKLQNAAQGHSNDMAEHNYMSHTGSDGSKMSQRIKAAGYDRTACGENVAAGHTSVEEVMTAWMASKRHRENILRPKFTMFGCGYAYSESSTYKHYWTQNFGTSKTEKCS
ncbi:unnamed protein product [Phytophthora lilii]|uniref:Unnamed protein product n=1 Tax=Phytophthora lilii TaxID=2077276 RepID=A0A9W6TEP7_9STRA|nr:unnamed protein product [Phytophthora lilii]